MKSRSLIWVVLLLIVAITAVASDTSTTAAAFERLKSLAGTWETKGPDGKTYLSTWSSVANGSAMLESMQAEGMVTMYHPDGGRLMLTHYCSAQNQPRMRAKISPDGKTMTFDFLDATNLASPNAGHMHKLVMTIDDKDHFSQQWFFFKDGKEADSETFHYTRKQ